MHVHLLGVQGLNFRNQIEPQEGSVRQGTLAAGKLSKDIARRTAFSRAGPEWLCTLLVIGVLLSVPANALDPQKLITQFTHTSWTAKDGIPGPVRAIAQTPDGYLWLGTEVGLYRFDGLRFVAWEPSFGERVPSSSVWSLYTARDGSLWIGFSSAGICQLHNGHLTTYSQADDVPPGGILSIVEDGSGSIWAGGPYGLSKLENGKWRRVGAEAGYPALGAQTMLVDQSGRLWVATDHFNFGLSSDSVNTNTILTLAPNAKQFTATGQAVGMIRSMASSSLGSVWMTHTSGDVVFVTSHGGSRARIPVAEPMCLLFDSDDSVWIGLGRGGLRRVSNIGNHHNPVIDQFQTSDGLSSNLVYSTFKDREGNLWFGTADGLDRIRENKATPFSSREGLVPDDHVAVTSTRDGSVWFASYTGDIVQRFRSGRFVSYKLPPSRPSKPNRILSLDADGESHVWVGGPFKLAQENDGKFSFSKVSDVAQVHDVHAITHDANGNLWVTVWDDEGGGVLRLRDGKWTNFRSGVRLPHYRCRVLYGDPQGRLWMGFEDGEVAVYESEEFRVYSSKDGLPLGRVFTIASDRAGHIWIGGEAGLSRFDHGHFVTLTKDNGLPGNSISAIVEDDDGFLWLAGALAVFHVNPLELDRAVLASSYRIQGESFDANDGFRGLVRQREPFPTATKAADGRLWFSTTAGVAVIDPRHLPKNILAPPVTIEALKADNRTLTDFSELHLRPKTRSLQFEYAAPSLTAPERVRFRYKLEGFDDNWRGPTSARYVTYTNLPPRNYRFRLIACNNDGVWNEAGASLNFTILPAFYQTNWFLLLCAAAAGCLAWATYQWRIRQVAARLDLNFKERLSERTRIARELHDTLLQSFQGLLLHFQRGRNLLPERTPEAMQMLDRALDGTEQAIVEGRDAIHDLRSFAPAPKSLAEELTSLGEELISKHGNSDPAQILVVIEGLAQTLRPQYHVEIFRIAREALRNAVGHAQARRIETEIAYSKKLFRLRIRDDGKGIDLRVPDRDEHAGHWGLTGMRERAERIGGQLDVWSEPGAGTEVELRIAGSIVYESSPIRANLQLFRKKKESDYERPA
jgi:signal transduction histidine kinase/ligand-binding sensor domain-containing protein